MKFEQSVLRAFALAAVLAFAVVVPGCKPGPIDYDAFEKRTIEENLAAIDSAGSLYQAQLAAGDIDAGAQQACAFLLGQSGVDTAVIAPDSTVWAFFSNGLLAGVCDDQVDTSGLSGTELPRRSDVRTQAGGEVAGAAYILPFDQELPGTKRAAEAIKDEFKRRLNWEESETFTGSAVDLGLALGEINPGSGVIFWSGHGLLYPPEPGAGWSSGLELGNPYNREAMAEAAVALCAGYLNPGPGLPRQAAIIHRARTGKFHIVILPPFIRAHGDFHVGENQPLINVGKTIVYLSCCYSAYGPGGQGRELMQSFLDAGADVVCGYDWEVGDAWSSEKDKTFFKNMADTCFPNEAVRLMGGLTDPTPGRQGFHATFQMVGDTTVLLCAVLQAEKDGTLYREASATAFIGGASKIIGYLRAEGSADEVGQLWIQFPGSAPGDFDVTTTDGAMLWWTDINTGRYYYAQKNYLGVSGHIKIDRCAGDIMTGSFSGTLGYWDWVTHNPYADPPEETVTFTKGIIKYTGKIMASALGIGWPGGEAAMRLIGRAGGAAMAR